MLNKENKKVEWSMRHWWINIYL